MDVYYHDATIPVTRNLNIKNNIFFSQKWVQETADFKSINNDLELLGTYDSNYYAQSINKENSIYSQYIKNGLTFSKVYNLPAWKLDYSDDQHSNTAATSMVEYKLNNLLSANKYSNGTYDLKHLVLTVTIKQAHVFHHGIIPENWMEVLINYLIRGHQRLVPVQMLL